MAVSVARASAWQAHARTVLCTKSYIIGWLMERSKKRTRLAGVVLALTASVAPVSAGATMPAVTPLHAATTPVPQDVYDDPRYAYRLAGAADRQRLDVNVIAFRAKQLRAQQIAKAQAAAANRIVHFAYQYHPVQRVTATVFRTAAAEPPAAIRQAVVVTSKQAYVTKKTPRAIHHVVHIRHRPKPPAVIARAPRMHATTNPQRVVQAFVPPPRPARRVSKPIRFSAPEPERSSSYGWGRL
jgi:hypothetical protein